MSIFDVEAKTYDRWYSTKMGAYVDEVETNCAFKLFPIKEGMQVLDVGCGTGNFSIKLAKMGCKVVGIDMSEEMLKIAQEKVRGRNLNIEFYKMDVLDLKFQDEYFDGIFSMAVFEFIQNPDRAMDEMFRVLRKNGHLLIGTINRDSRWGQMYLTEEFQKNSVFKYANFKTVEEMKNLKKDYLVKVLQCLYIPPDAKDEDISLEKELELSKTGKGGFICALWKK